MKLPNFFPLVSLPLMILLFYSHVGATTYNVSDAEAAFTNPLIQETCKKVALNDPNLSYGFCSSALQSAPDSLCADSLRELGHLSIKLLRDNITSTRCYIKQLLRDKKIDQYVRSCLNDCLELYSDAIPTTKQAIKDYKAKRYDNANVEVSSVTDAATTCEDGFGERKGTVSPVKKRNENAFKLSVLSLSIINMLSHST